MTWLVLAGALAQPTPTDAGAPPAPVRGIVVPAHELDALRHELRELRAAVEANRTAARHASVVAYGDQVHVPHGREVDEAVAFGEDIRVDGKVLQNVTAMGGNIVIGPTGRVLGDAVAFGGTVSIEPGGELRGNRVDLSEQALAPAELQASDEGWFAMLYRRIVLLLSLAGAGVLVVGLFPRRVAHVSRQLEAHPVWSAIVGGTVSALLTVFGILFTLITLGLGLPISFLGVALLAAAWLFGFVGLCQALGDRLPFAEKPHGRWLTFLFGMAMVACVGSLPWVGILTVFVASMISIGAAITSRFGSHSDD